MKTNIFAMAAASVALVMTAPVSAQKNSNGKVIIVVVVVVVLQVTINGTTVVQLSPSSLTIIKFMAATLAVSSLAIAAPASAQVAIPQGGLVNVAISDVSILDNFLNDAQIAALNNLNVPITVQVPVGIAADVCGVAPPSSAAAVTRRRTAPRRAARGRSLSQSTVNCLTSAAKPAGQFGSGAIAAPLPFCAQGRREPPAERAHENGGRCRHRPPLAPSFDPDQPPCSGFGHFSLRRRCFPPSLKRANPRKLQSFSGPSWNDPSRARPKARQRFKMFLPAPTRTVSIFPEGSIVAGSAAFGSDASSRFRSEAAFPSAVARSHPPPSRTKRKIRFEPVDNEDIGDRIRASRPELQTDAGTRDLVELARHVHKVGTVFRRSGRSHIIERHQPGQCDPGGPVDESQRGGSSDHGGADREKAVETADVSRIEPLVDMARAARDSPFDQPCDRCRRKPQRQELGRVLAPGRICDMLGEDARRKGDEADRGEEQHCRQVEVMPRRAIDRAREMMRRPVQADDRAGDRVAQIGGHRRTSSSPRSPPPCGISISTTGNVNAIANTASAKASMREVPRVAPSPSNESRRIGSWIVNPR